MFGRNFQKIKEIQDYQQLDYPEPVIGMPTPLPPYEDQRVLRMLVRPKYGDFRIPEVLKYLQAQIYAMAEYDRQRTGINDSWCYVTVRHGIPRHRRDDQWHFDGSSFRTDIIPERNYIWVNENPTEYKFGKLNIPADFNPVIHDLFSFAAHQLRGKEVKQMKAKEWYLLSPFVLHRRPIEAGLSVNGSRTFYRICFTDIEGRDINNTFNPDLPTEFFGRDPVKTFRNNLIDYYKDIR